METIEIFESILNEEKGRTNYPQKTQFNSGKVKKVPLVMKYIYENPGCTKEEIINFTNAMGFTGYNNELLVDIRDDKMAETRYLNNRGKLGFYPTATGIGYLHSLGFIDDTSGDQAYQDFLDQRNRDSYLTLWQKVRGVMYDFMVYHFIDNFSRTQKKQWMSLGENEQRKILIEVIKKFDLSKVY